MHIPPLESVSVAATPPYLAGLTKSAETLTTSDGQQIDVWELSVQTTDPCMSSWATAFRQHYCPDEEIDDLRSGTGLSREEYLIQLVFPGESSPPGPSIRAGDFAELLVCDYVEYLLGYWVPRGKYAEKASRDESVKGVDILGFRKYDNKKPSQKDTLLAFEVKAQFSGSKYKGRLQTAIDDSSKDYLRRGMSLNATKRRLLKGGELEKAEVVERFQNLSDNPYDYRSGAAAVLSNSVFDIGAIQDASDTSNHNNADNVELIVIRGNELMSLVHSLYQTAADEA